MIIKIENNKIKVLRLYSKIKIEDARLSLQKCENFYSCLI